MFASYENTRVPSFSQNEKDKCAFFPPSLLVRVRKFGALLQLLKIRFYRTAKQIRAETE